MYLIDFHNWQKMHAHWLINWMALKKIWLFLSQVDSHVCISILYRWKFLWCGWWHKFELLVDLININRSDGQVFVWTGHHDHYNINELTWRLMVWIFAHVIYQSLIFHLHLCSGLVWFFFFCRVFGSTRGRHVLVGALSIFSVM